MSQKLLSFVGSKREVEREKFYGYSDEKKKSILVGIVICICYHRTAVMYI